MMNYFEGSNIISDLEFSLGTLYTLSSVCIFNLLTFIYVAGNFSNGTDYLVFLVSGQKSLSSCLENVLLFY